MSEQSLNQNEIEWMETLAPFRHGARLLPCAWPPDGTVSERGVVRVPLAFAAEEWQAAAALALVLFRYNGGEPVLLALPAADGGLTFLRVDGNETEDGDAEQFLARVRKDMDAARLRTACPLDRVSAGLGVDQTVQNAAFLQAGISHGATSSLSAQAGLWIHVGRELECHFDRSQYATAFIEQFARHIARTLQWLATAGTAPLRDLALLTGDELAAITRWSTGTRAGYADGLTLHGLIEAQARRTPDALAVVHKGRTLTYGQLDARSTRIATALRRHYGVKTGDVVGVMISRSESTPVALLGVMKAGAAYVPLNPRHPWETLGYMIANAGVSVLIVDADSIAGAALFSGKLLVIDVELRGEAPADPAPVPVQSSDLAYVIYTSGSTGKPKGVAVEHRAVVNTILWRNDFYGINAEDVNLQIPSFAFDSSVVDIFCVLSAGGVLLVPEEDMRLDIRHLKELSAKRGVTSCIVTPSYYKLLVAELKDAVPTLRFVTLAGETVTPDLVAAHLEHLPGVTLYNEYGPTENAVCSTACRLEAVEETVSIGPPIANVQVFMLDAERRLCPPGVAGEMLLGGAGLARGYINQPALTAERFVPVPDTLAGLATGVLYRTGDRAAWRIDGGIEFLGRLDSQVKIRGFRIELDEVELALRQSGAVRNAAVLCKDDPSGTKYLAAYVEAEAGVDAAAIRDHLRNALPYYMVPDVVSVMPQLPLNLNGKVDRGVLKAVDDFAGPETGPASLMSPIEAGLLELSADVLHRVNMTLDDNFFELGGNSLAVMELTSRIRGELSLEVELIDIYTFPTIRELADRLSEARIET